MRGSGALRGRSTSQVSPSPSVGLSTGGGCSPCTGLSRSLPPGLPRVITPCLRAAKIGVVVPAPEGWEVMPTAAVASPD